MISGRELTFIIKHPPGCELVAIAVAAAVAAFAVAVAAAAATLCGMQFFGSGVAYGEDFAFEA